MKKHPNIIWIMADDMGYGDPACNGNGRIPTPHMDQLAREGVCFTDAHATSAVCSPSRYSVLTGRYNWRSRLKRKLIGGFDSPLIDSGRATVASFLKSAGYQTAAIGKWHLGLDWPVLRRTDNLREGWNDPGNIDYARPISGGPTELGFDRFFGLAGSLNLPPFCFIEDRNTVGIPDQPFAGSEAFTEGCPEGFTVEGWRFEDVDLRHCEEALSFIRRRDREQPFFLHLTPSAPHTPWLPPERFKGASGISARGDLICLLDWIVGQVVETLAEEGIADDTLIIVTSDNGALECEQEHKLGHASNGTLRGKKGDAFEGGHRVPFLARWPAVIPSGSVCEHMISLMDLFATAADIIEEPLPRNAAGDSVSFLPLLAAPATAAPVRQHLIQHSVLGRFALREDQWKLIDACDSGGWRYKEWVTAGPGEPDGMLYDLARDLAETRNLWLDQPERVTAMLARLQELQDFGTPR